MRGGRGQRVAVRRPRHEARHRREAHEAGGPELGLPEVGVQEAAPGVTRSLAPGVPPLAGASAPSRRSNTSVNTELHLWTAHPPPPNFGCVHTLFYRTPPFV